MFVTRLAHRASSGPLNKVHDRISIVLRAFSRISKYGFAPYPSISCERTNVALNIMQWCTADGNPNAGNIEDVKGRQPVQERAFDKKEACGSVTFHNTNCRIRTSFGSCAFVEI